MKSGKRAFYEKMETPLGEICFFIDNSRSLLAIAFLNPDRKPGIQQTWKKTAAELAKEGFELLENPTKTASTKAALEDYFAGGRTEFEMERAPRGTEFQRQIWSLLERIPRGETLTYSDLAEAVGRPRAARAVGRAVATNPIPIVIPCHRVVGADGSLRGFAGGLRFKKGLLELEKANA